MRNCYLVAADGRSRLMAFTLSLLRMNSDNRINLSCLRTIPSTHVLTFELLIKEQIYVLRDPSICCISNMTFSILFSGFCAIPFIGVSAGCSVWVGVELVGTGDGPLCTDNDGDDDRRLTLCCSLKLAVVLVGPLFALDVGTFVDELLVE